MPQRHFSSIDLQELFGVSAATIGRWWRNGTIPRPKRVGRRLLRWSQQDVEAIGQRVQADQTEHDGEPATKG